MYQLIHSNGILPTLTREAPAATAAMVVAELLYKFHSFTLECLAFLATWFVFSCILAFVLDFRRTASTDN